MMDPMVINPRVNGVIYSGNSCSFTVNGAPMVGVLELSYEQKRTRKAVYGAKRSGTVLGKTSGKYEVSCTLKLLRSTEDWLTTFLTPFGLGSYGDAQFLLTVSTFEPAITPAVPLVSVLLGCTIDGKKNSHAEGIDELVSELEIGVMTVTENGKILWSLVRDVP